MLSLPSPESRVCPGPCTCSVLLQLPLPFAYPDSSSAAPVAEASLTPTVDSTPSPNCRMDSPSCCGSCQPAAVVPLETAPAALPLTPAGDTQEGLFQHPRPLRDPPGLHWSVVELLPLPALALSPPSASGCSPKGLPESFLTARACSGLLQASLSSV